MGANNTNTEIPIYFRTAYHVVMQLDKCKSGFNTSSYTDSPFFYQPDAQIL